ncbi:MAG: MopE-related protein [Patescibacteria group bacterium]
MNFKKLKLSKSLVFASVFIAVAVAAAFLSLRPVGPPALAASDCRLNVTASGNISVSPVSGSNCTITAGTIEGVDSGDLIIPANKTITIGSGAQLVMDPNHPLDKTALGTKIIIEKPSAAGGAIVKGYICAVDADNDGYADKVGSNSEPIYQYSASPDCPANTVRKASLGNNITQLDCVSGTGQKLNATCSPKLGNWEDIGGCGDYAPGIQYQKMDWTRTTLTAANCGGNDCVLSGTDYDYTTTCECNPGATTTYSCGTGNCTRSGTKTCGSDRKWGAGNCVAGTPGTCQSLGYECGQDLSDGCGNYNLNCGNDNSSTSCTVGVGACQNTGTKSRTCSGGVWGTYGACSATAGIPSTEICNGDDDDCDGSTDAIDSDLLPQTQSCTVGVGNCARTGTQSRTCFNGAWPTWGACSATPGTPDTCSSLGYVCGSSVSDGCGGTLNCGTDTSSTSCTVGEGDCQRTGTKTRSCSGGAWGAYGACSATAGAPTKTCATAVEDGAFCGTPPNGCGGTLSCGSCGTGYTCSNYKCVFDGANFTTGYTDVDKDGYGSGSYGIWANSSSYNVVSNDSDCDDSNASITPGSYATCDSNGDGAACGYKHCSAGSWTSCQDDDSATYYRDADGDGAGDPSVSTTACQSSWGPPVCHSEPAICPSTWCNSSSSGYYITCSCFQIVCPPQASPVKEFISYGGYTYVRTSNDCNDSNSNITSSSSSTCDSNGDGSYCGTKTCSNGLWSSCTGDHSLQAYYYDFDYDGLGNPSQTIYACTDVHIGYPSSTDGTDCNDNDANIKAYVFNTYSCSVGTGACQRSGTYDHYCLGGVWGSNNCRATAGSPSSETCNGVDDDCDGSVDEGLSQSTSCSAGTGACYRTGTMSRTCAGDGSWNPWGACSATAGSPSSESCNGVDDDCDGSTDEGLSQSTSCTVGTGYCANTGTQSRSCSGGSWSSWSSCSASPLSPPSCSYFGYVCGSSMSNGCGGTMNCGSNSQSQSCSVGTGACYRTGTQSRSCSGGSWGSWGSCSATAGSPSSESCNGTDDDCDGSTDEGTNYNQSCNNGQSGSCYRTGTYYMACNNGSYIQTTGCSAPYVAPGTCSSLGYSCGSSMSNGCGGTINCGANSRTRSCTVGGSPGYYYDTCSGGSWSNGTTCYKS